MGGLFGGMFGLMLTATEHIETPENATTKQKILINVKSMGARTFSYSKNFAAIGTVFSGIECVVEKQRGKTDVWNGLTAGCLTGSAFAVRAGPQAMALGCVGFAAFCGAIEWFTRPEDVRLGSEKEKMAPEQEDPNDVRLPDTNRSSSSSSFKFFGFGSEDKNNDTGSATSTEVERDKSDVRLPPTRQPNYYGDDDGE